MEKLKELYSFTVNEKREKTVKETSKNEAGEEVTISKKVEMETPVHVLLKKPSRRQLEDAELEYSLEISRCIKKGMLTKAMLSKKYADTGGLMSEGDAKGLMGLYKDLIDAQTNYQKIESLGAKSKASKEKSSALLGQCAEIRRKIIEMESNYRSLFDHTADVRAQNRQILWFALNLSFIKRDEDEYSPLFKGETFEEKLDFYYEKAEEEDVVYSEIYRKISMALAFWQYNNLNTKEEFDDLFKKIEDGEI